MTTSSQSLPPAAGEAAQHYGYEANADASFNVYATDGATSRTVATVSSEREALFIVRACNSYESLKQENARAHESYEGMNHAYQQVCDDHSKLLESHASSRQTIAALVGALQNAVSDTESGLAQAHIKLSALLEDEGAESKDIRKAAIDLCGAVEAHKEQARAALTSAQKGGAL